MRLTAYHRVAALLLITIVSACSNNDHVFSENVTVNLPDPKLATLTNDGMVHAKLVSKNEIKGFTYDAQFLTGNLFKTFMVSPGGIGHSKILYETNEHVLLYDYNWSTFSVSITERSTEYGLSYWHVAGLSPYEEKRIGQYYYNGFIDYKDACFISREKGWIVGRYNRSSNGPDQHLFPDGIRVYAVTSDTCAQVGIIEGNQYDPVDIFFENEMDGYLVADHYWEEDTSYFFKTSDGGQTWTNMHTFNKNVTTILSMGNASFLVRHDAGYYQTVDGGSNWQASTVVINPLETICLPDGTLYAVVPEGSDSIETISSLYKSEDKGLTWIKVNGKEFYGRRIHFLNKDIGIAYTYNTLQYTENGGVDWKLLVYSLGEE